MITEQCFTLVQKESSIVPKFVWSMFQCSGIQKLRRLEAREFCSSRGWDRAERDCSGIGFT